MSLLPQFLFTAQKASDNLGFGPRIWHKEQHSLVISPCFPPDLQWGHLSVPSSQLFAVSHFLPGCLLFPPPSGPLRIITIQDACFRDPAVTQFDLLPWHTDCVVRPRYLPWCAPLRATNHQYAPGLSSFASVKSWPLQPLCVRYFFLPVYFLSLSLIWEFILIAQINVL